jgi:hypothetical protein
MENLRSVSFIPRGLLVVSLLVFCCCLCQGKDLQTTESKERFCSKDSEDEVEICDVEEENKYSQDMKDEKTRLNGLPIELNDLRLSNSTLEDLGVKPVEPIQEWKSVNIPVLDGVKVKVNID